MKVLIATQNKGKVEGAKRAFEKYFDDVEVVGISAKSNVPEQPVNEETWQGAKNRVKNLKQYAKENSLEADFFISIESGMMNSLGSWMIVNIAVVEDKNGLESISCSPGFPVPEKLVEKIKEIGLGQVMDNHFNESDLRSRGGGIQLLTHDVVSRIDLTELAFEMALTKFINGEYWK
ncbi:MAG: DUF84 family protein [Clostridia bacterium]|nr:DUF84 family protein [Clostridia bacterium]